MGSIRLLLALSVIAAHTGANFGVTGKLAVELFFLVSGFLITHILVGENHYRSTKVFYINRALRIYPIYWLVALTSLALNVVMAFVSASPVFRVFRTAGLDGMLLLLFSNIAVFLQDGTLFLDKPDGTWRIVDPGSGSHLRLHEGLLVPPAWSLSLELTFYLLAPFLVRSQRLLLLTFLGSTFVKISLLLVGLSKSDPWSYRFFPAELSIFLLGAISYRYILPIAQRVIMTNNSAFLNVIRIFSLAILLGFPYYPWDEEGSGFFVIAIMALCLPALFSIQTASPIEKILADLSYPTYLWHVLVFAAVSRAGHLLGAAFDPGVTFILVALLTISLAHLTNLTIGRKVEKIRSAMKRENYSVTAFKKTASE